MFKFLKKWFNSQDCVHLSKECSTVRGIEYGDYPEMEEVKLSTGKSYYLHHIFSYDPFRDYNLAFQKRRNVCYDCIMRYRKFMYGEDAPHVNI